MIYYWCYLYDMSYQRVVKIWLRFDCCIDHQLLGYFLLGDYYEPRDRMGIYKSTKYKKKKKKKNIEPE